MTSNEGILALESYFQHENEPGKSLIHSNNHAVRNSRHVLTILLTCGRRKMSPRDCKIISFVLKCFWPPLFMFSSFRIPIMSEALVCYKARWNKNDLDDAKFWEEENMDMHRGNMHRGVVEDVDSRSSKNSGMDYDLELASHASSNDGGLGVIPSTLSSSGGLSPKPTVAVQEQEGIVESSLNVGTATPPTRPTTDQLSRMPSSLQEEDDEDDDEDENESDTDQEEEDSPVSSRPTRPGFVSALLDSTIPRDVMDNTAGIVKGAYHVEKRTLLHHATTADQYDLFRNTRKKAQQHNNNNCLPK